MGSGFPKMDPQKMGWWMMITTWTRYSAELKFGTSNGLRALKVKLTFYNIFLIGSSLNGTASEEIRIFTFSHYYAKGVFLYFFASFSHISKFVMALGTALVWKKHPVWIWKPCSTCVHTYEISQPITPLSLQNSKINFQLYLFHHYSR